MLRFPDGFLWGLATAAYQIEGAVSEDGRGESIWDRFSHTPGKVANGETGDVACDHYHRWPADLDLLQQLSASAYRFSVAWPRIQAEGRGLPNRRGLEFYSRLVDGLLARGIRPAATLYHWDLPQALQDRGGWPNRDTAHRFAEYADHVYRALGDRVDLWITHNEPWVVAIVGHLHGVHAPGLTDLHAALATAHHLLLSHGLAVDAYRASGLGAPIGITLNLFDTVPHSDSDEDVEAVRASDGYTNRWYLDPVLRGSYPDDTLAQFGRLVERPLDFIRAGDLEVTSRPIDFLGVNYYHPRVVRADPSDRFGWSVVPGARSGLSTTGLGYEVVPEGLYALLTHLHREYPGVPLYITENGAAYQDGPDRDGRVRDPGRVEYLRDHMAAAHRAIGDGVDLRGYFVWSLLDNFEWALGYRPRFGVVYVDYETQERTPKLSADFFREVAEANAVDADRDPHQE
jgi:beta-glucosidase